MSIASLKKATLSVENSEPDIHKIQDIDEANYLRYSRHCAQLSRCAIEWLSLL
jgi:hypothetical protein